jgi:proteasome activator subunit 4
MFTSLSDHRSATTYPFVSKLLPEFFRIQEILDNEELRSTAFRVVVAVACLPFPQDVAQSIMSQLIGLLRNSDSWRVRLDVLLPLQS